MSVSVLHIQLSFGTIFVFEWIWLFYVMCLWQFIVRMVHFVIKWQMLEPVLTSVRWVEAVGQQSPQTYGLGGVWAPRGHTHSHAVERSRTYISDGVQSRVRANAEVWTRYIIGDRGGDHDHGHTELWELVPGRGQLQQPHVGLQRWEPASCCSGGETNGRKVRRVKAFKGEDENIAETFRYKKL